MRIDEPQKKRRDGAKGEKRGRKNGGHADRDGAMILRQREEEKENYSHSSGSGSNDQSQGYTSEVKKV
jgi:hypothetical protein